jgi:hypothetical protein
LKNKKASGIDGIANEYLKVISPVIRSMYCKIFNLVFDSGIVPDSWSIEIILLIYKNKGDPLDPENCRAMTLVSCFGKLFTSILNKRLTLFSNQTEILKEKQTGFRKGYSTTDNIPLSHTCQAREKI